MTCPKCTSYRSGPEGSTEFPPEEYTGLPTNHFYGSKHGPWRHSFDVETYDAHTGWFVYMTDHDDGGLMMFDADFMVDPELRIVHVYNMIHVHNNDDYPGGDSTDNTLRCGIKQVKRAHFPFFFKTLKACLAFFVSQFFGSGWRYGIGFDSRHCENVRQRGLSVVLRSGLASFLPVSVLNAITDSLATWAVPVLMCEALGKSQAYSFWLKLHRECGSKVHWHPIVYLDRLQFHSLCSSVVFPPG